MTGRTAASLYVVGLSSVAIATLFGLACVGSGGTLQGRYVGGWVGDSTGTVRGIIDFDKDGTARFGSGPERTRYAVHGDTVWIEGASTSATMTMMLVSADSLYVPGAGGKAVLVWRRAK